MNIDTSELLTSGECFFCNPEVWRTIFGTNHVLLLAGAGPICPGYVILAPREHVHTVSALEPRILGELLAMFELVKRAFTSLYRPGWTAYEHGRVGACAVLESKGDLSTFCHHAHRVAIPCSTRLKTTIRTRFGRARQLRSERDITKAPSEYVFYETGIGDMVERLVFEGPMQLPSQFMRRLLTDHLGTGRPWNWAADLRIDEMIETTSLMRSEFVGLANGRDDELPRSRLRLREHVSLDGLAYAGKTAIAHALAARAECRVIDTGLIFRHMATQQIEGGTAEKVDMARIRAAMVAVEGEAYLKQEKVAAAAAHLAADPRHRKKQFQIIGTLLAEIGDPCILVGRDSWRWIAGEGVRIRVEADFETRLRRRLLAIAGTDSWSGAGEISQTMRNRDAGEEKRLPPPTLPGLITITNSRRPFVAVINETMTQVLARWSS